MQIDSKKLNAGRVTHTQFLIVVVLIVKIVIISNSILVIIFPLGTIKTFYHVVHVNTTFLHIQINICSPTQMRHLHTIQMMEK